MAKAEKDLERLEKELEHILAHTQKHIDEAIKAASGCILDKALAEYGEAVWFGLLPLPTEEFVPTEELIPQANKKYNEFRQKILNLLSDTREKIVNTMKKKCRCMIY